MLRYAKVNTSRGLILTSVLFVLGAGIFPGLSGAAVPPEFSVTDQYAETIPGVTGGKKVNDAKTGKPRRSAKLKALGNRGEDGSKLSELVALTAPAAALSSTDQGSKPGSAGKAREATAAGSSSTESDSPIVAIADQALEPADVGSVGIIFPIALIFLTALAIGYSVTRIRGNSSRLS